MFGIGNEVSVERDIRTEAINHVDRLIDLLKQVDGTHALPETCAKAVEHVDVELTVRGVALAAVSLLQYVSGNIDTIRSDRTYCVQLNLEASIAVADIRRVEKLPGVLINTNTSKPRDRDVIIFSVDEPSVQRRGHEFCSRFSGLVVQTDHMKRMMTLANNLVKRNTVFDNAKSVKDPLHKFVRGFLSSIDFCDVTQAFIQVDAKGRIRYASAQVGEPIIHDGMVPAMSKTTHGTSIIRKYKLSDDRAWYDPTTQKRRKRRNFSIAEVAMIRNVAQNTPIEDACKQLSDIFGFDVLPRDITSAMNRYKWV